MSDIGEMIATFFFPMMVAGILLAGLLLAVVFSVGYWVGQGGLP